MHPLKSVLSYYSSSVAVNAEGDTAIREETLEGLGRPPSFLEILFGAILKIAASKRKSSLPSDLPSQPSTTPVQTESIEDIYELDQGQLSEYVMADEDTAVVPSLKKSLLTEILPHPGYFAAGGLAGVISRTATAPLDRLKVYLIANTGEVASESVKMAQKGKAAAAVKKVGRPLVEATKELWKAGGMRSLFAGMAQTPRSYGIPVNECRKWPQCSQGDARVSYKVWFL